MDLNNKQAHIYGSVIDYSFKGMSVVFVAAFCFSMFVGFDAVVNTIRLTLGWLCFILLGIVALGLILKLAAYAYRNKFKKPSLIKWIQANGNLVVRSSFFVAVTMMFTTMLLSMLSVYF